MLEGKYCPRYFEIFWDVALGLMLALGDPLPSPELLALPFLLILLHFSTRWGKRATYCIGMTKHHQNVAPLKGDQWSGSRGGDRRIFLNLFFNNAKLLYCHEVLSGSGFQITKNLHLVYWDFWPLFFERIVNLYQVGLSSRLATKQVFPGIITEMFPTSSDTKHKIEGFNRLTTVMMAVHNRVNPMNNVLYLAEVRQLIVSGCNKIFPVPSDSYDF